MNVHQMIEERKMDHSHNDFKDSRADHDHQTKQEDPIEKRLSGKFSGIENMKKFRVLKPRPTVGEEKGYIFNLF